MLLYAPRTLSSMVSARSLINNVRRVAQNPRLLLGEGRKFATQANKAYHSRRNTEFGELVIDRDWDNLLILDACRYDIFAQQYGKHRLNGDLLQFTSAASQSWEFMEKNFQGRELHDTVYVSANPYTPGLDEQTFHALLILLDRWDEQKQTVLPEIVTEEARKAADRYQNKRLIVHFMQPHYPFLGPTGQKIDHRGYDGGESVNSSEPAIWGLLQWGHKGYDNVTEKNVWQAYRENVDIAIEAAKDLAADLEGKTVLTSDHGLFIGERMRPIPAKGYGHQAGLRSPEVTEVPWFEFPHDKRKDVESDPPDVYTEMESEIVEDRLSAFGYK
jgi:hypothetical protein